MKTMYKKRNNTKLTLSIVVALTLIITSFGLWRAGAGDKIISEREILRGQLIRGELNTELGSQSVYPEYYAGYVIYNLNNTEIENGLIKDAALKWWAEDNHFTVSYKEVDEYISNLIADAKDSDEYTEYENAAKDLGTTFEHVVRIDSETYKDIILKSKVYEHITADVTEKEISSEKIDELEKDMEREWNDFEDRIVNNYKLTNEYKKLIVELKICEQLAKCKVTDTETIKRAYMDNSL